MLDKGFYNIIGIKQKDLGTTIAWQAIATVLCDVVCSFNRLYFSHMWYKYPVLSPYQKAYRNV